MTPHETERLSAYLDGALEPRDRGEVELHLRSCPECREEIDLLRAVDAAAAALPASAPEGYFGDFASRVRARIDDRQRGGVGRARSMSTRWRVPVWAWAAAAALLLVVITPLTLRQTRTPDAATVAAPSATAGIPPQPPSKSAPTVLAEPQIARERLQERKAGGGSPRSQGPSAAAPDRETTGRLPGVTPATPPPPAAAAAPAAPPAKAAADRGDAPQLSPIGPEEARYADRATGEREKGEASLADEAPEQEFQATTERATRKDAARRRSTLEGRSAAAPAPRAVSPTAEAAGRPAVDLEAAGIENGVQGRVAGDVAGLGMQTSAADAAEAEFRQLSALRPGTVAEWRALRDRWQAFASARPGGPHADEAAVRAIVAGVEVMRHGGSQADEQLLRAAGEAYLARSDAPQKPRVRRLLAGAAEDP